MWIEVTTESGCKSMINLNHVARFWTRDDDTCTDIAFTDQGFTIRVTESYEWLKQCVQGSPV